MVTARCCFAFCTLPAEHVVLFEGERMESCDAHSTCPKVTYVGKLEPEPEPTARTNEGEG